MPLILIPLLRAIKRRCQRKHDIEATVKRIKPPPAPPPQIDQQIEAALSNEYVAS